MTFDEYAMLAARTAKPMGSTAADLTHAALGIHTEGGEFATEVKRTAIYNAVPNMPHMAEELGDLLWYIALAANTLGVSLDRIAVHNIAKLRLRFPEKYTDEHAEKRLDKGGRSARES